MKKRNPWEDYSKHKDSDKKRHQARHSGSYGHFCKSWFGHYICEDCTEFSTCECGPRDSKQLLQQQRNRKGSTPRYSGDMFPSYK